MLALVGPTSLRAERPWPDPGGILDELRAESDELDALVAGLAPKEWSRPTPAPRWSIAHQVAHVAWTDEWAVRAATDPDGFVREVRRAVASPLEAVDAQADIGAAAPA
ncbi:maleylpyruvate isomerase N-terminal domain-containing protein [Actinacidiphila oryziradicis]|nr:maleylpyruvate isomerase N-terminal domain-containing protein [Actinacidiphila oryziradicis]